MTEAPGNYDAQAAADHPRSCTCYPGERPEPCTHQYATRDCWRVAILAETQVMIIALKNRDREPIEQARLDYLMRVRHCLEV